MRRSLLLLALAVVVVGLTRPAGAVPMLFVATLDGPSESPPVASPGTGLAFVEIDPAADTLTVSVTFSGLVAPTTVAHIHAPTASPFSGTIGVAVSPGTFPGFPAGVTSGAYLHTFDTSDSATYTAAYLAAKGGTPAGAEAGLIADIEAGKAYVNIHTSAFPGGEIRGFLVAAATPEPVSAGLVGLGLLGLGVVGWRRR